jgi:hypothetical protein
MDWSRRAIPIALVLIFFVLLLMQFPIKSIPRSKDYAFCRAIESAVQSDIRSGRKILISHGTEFYIRAGVKTPPRDQANAFLEIHNAGRDDLLSDFRARIDSHYYDRIYLMVDCFYSDEMIEAINRNYKVQSIIPSTTTWGVPLLMTDCKILAPRQ